MIKNNHYTISEIERFCEEWDKTVIPLRQFDLSGILLTCVDIRETEVILSTNLCKEWDDLMEKIRRKRND